MSTQDKTKKPLLTILVLILLLITVIIAYQHAAIPSLILLITFFTGSILKEKKNIFLLAASDLCLSIAGGLAIVVLLVVLYYMLSPLAYFFGWNNLPGAIESFLLESYFKVHEINEKLETWSIRMLIIAIVVILLLAGRYWPRLQLIKLFTTGKSILFRTGIVLATITSFTFCSGTLVTQHATANFQDMNANFNTLSIEKKKEWREYLAAHYLTAQLTAMSDKDSQYFQQLFHTINGNAQVLENVGKEQAGNLKQHLEPIPPQDLDIPASMEEWHANHQKIQTLSTEVDQQKIRTNEARKAAVEILAEVCGFPLSKANEYIKPYVDAFVDHLSEFAIDKLQPEHEELETMITEKSGDIREYVENKQHEVETEKAREPNPNEVPKEHPIEPK